MSEHLNFYKSVRGGTNLMLDIEKDLGECGLEESLLHLVKIRASQINGSSTYRSRDARQNGETEQRLYVLDAWLETPLFNPCQDVRLSRTAMRGECL